MFYHKNQALGRSSPCILFFVILSNHVVFFDVTLRTFPLTTEYYLFRYCFRDHTLICLQFNVPLSSSTKCVPVQTNYLIVSSLLPTDDRSHVIERSMNRRTGDEERKQDFINIDEGEFHCSVCLFYYKWWFVTNLF